MVFKQFDELMKLTSGQNTKSNILEIKQFENKIREQWRKRRETGEQFFIHVIVYELESVYHLKLWNRLFNGKTINYRISFFS